MMRARRCEVPVSSPFRFLFAVVLLAGCATAPRSNVHLDSVRLPGAPADGLFLDFIAFDPAHERVWVPAGGSGRVDVLDARTLELVEIQGFPTAEVERRGQKRAVGPTSVALGEGVAYVGNRGDSSVWTISEDTLAKGSSVTLDSMPDALAYVRSTREVWVTTPSTQSIVILDASTPGVLTRKGVVKLDGEPECSAVDETRGIFYTNLEDRDRTEALDLRTHQVLQTWHPECGGDGPRGLALDGERNLLFVACPDGARVLDAGHGGAVLATLEAGPGVDAIDFVPSTRTLYVAAARAAKLVVAHIGENGTASVIRTVTTAQGARNPAATPSGLVFLADGPEARVLVLRP
jgi:DNA-binding beta-propeller fold protein YncE